VFPIACFDVIGAIEMVTDLELLMIDNERIKKRAWKDPGEVARCR
jgi:hypothetical protein